MKYLKKYEILHTHSKSARNSITIHIYEIEREIGLDVYIDAKTGEPTLKSRYDIDFVDFCKEIFLNKDIAVKTLDRPKNNPLIRGKVENIDLYFYQDEFYMKVKIDDEWHLIETNAPLTVYYPDDIKNKPLHKELKLKKKEEKYNL